MREDTPAPEGDHPMTLSAVAAGAVCNVCRRNTLIEKPNAHGIGTHGWCESCDRA